MSKKLEGFVEKLTALGGGSGDSRDVYDEWAPTYERNLQEDYGYVAPGIAVETFARYCANKTTRVLDLGCGTGLVGEALAANGFKHLDGLDISPLMLDEARAKQIYADLIVADMTQPLDLGTRTYGAALGVGCFGGGHVGPEHLKEMIGCVAPGGLLTFYINAIPYAEDDYPRHFAALEAQGAWKVLLTEESNYMEALDRPGWTVVARRT
ncbi:MAG: methyltransferase domain-containing protein [Gammaproteobacteria bacterium]|nr:methyltransferase domain-containing protein [Gammaproteobacteria bacterium]